MLANRPLKLLSSNWACDIGNDKERRRRQQQQHPNQQHATANGYYLKSNYMEHYKALGPKSGNQNVKNSSDVRLSRDFAACPPTDSTCLAAATAQYPWPFSAAMRCQKTKRNGIKQTTTKVMMMAAAARTASTTTTTAVAATITATWPPGPLDATATTTGTSSCPPVVATANANYFSGAAAPTTTRTTTITTKAASLRQRRGAQTAATLSAALVVVLTMTTLMTRVALARGEQQQPRGQQRESVVDFRGGRAGVDFASYRANNSLSVGGDGDGDVDAIGSFGSEMATIVVAGTNRDISFNTNNNNKNNQNYNNNNNHQQNYNNYNNTSTGEDNAVLLMMLTASSTTTTTSSSSTSSSLSSLWPPSSAMVDGGGVGGAGADVGGVVGGVDGAADGSSLSVVTGSDSTALDVEADENADATEYIFDRTDVRIIFITLYTLVFCCCFFGNLLVILVVTLSRRLRSITNFFLANLALADFCVGLFCVMQNLSIYLIDSWVFGEFLCRMYQFVHSLSYTASIFILVVICMERYFAIVHPITCKQILTAARLRMVILTVWITSAVYSTPKFVFSKTIKNIHTEDGQEEEICVLDRKMFNSKLLDMINFVLLYVIPLLVMTVLYSKIAIALWRSSRGLTHHIQQQQQENNGLSMHNSMYQHHHPQQAQQQQLPPHHLHHSNHNHHYHHMQHQQAQVPGTPLSSSSSGGGGAGGILSRRQSSKYEKQRGVSITESQVSLDADRAIVSACRKPSFYQQHHHHHHHQPIVIGNPQSQAELASSLTSTGMVAGMPTTMVQQQQQHAHLQRHGGTQRVTHNMSHSSSNVLRARRGVVRMLIIFVLTFALCNLPYHARKMWQYWSRSYRGDSNFNALLTPLTFLVTYFNSGINPLLYAFLSRNFRKGMKELLLCSWRKGKGKSSSNSSMHHKRMALQTHSLPTDTTHIGNEQL